MNQFYFNKIINRSVLFRRAIAMLIDMFVISVVSLLPEYIAFLLDFKYDTLIWLLFVWILSFLRDVSGRGLGKTIMKLHVIDVRTNRQASWKKRVVRNITSPFWMIELTICAITNGLRITDFWFGTKVVSDTDILL